MRFFFVSLAILLSVGTAVAEMRIWSDKKGNTIEAEYIKIIGAKVVLKTAEGKQLKVPVSGLCDADKDYLASTIPPKIKIEVDVDKDRDTLSSYSSEYGTYGREQKAESICCSVQITKINQEACNQDFKAFIYVFGEDQRSKRTRVLDISNKEFTFKHAKTMGFKSKQVTVEFTKDSYYGNSGYRYSGYVAFVTDRNDKIVAIESTKTAYESNIQKIRKAKRNATLDRDFDVVSSRRH